jgi:hypothetical protein
VDPTKGRLGEGAGMSGSLQVRTKLIQKPGTKPKLTPSFLPIRPVVIIASYWLAVAISIILTTLFERSMTPHHMVTQYMSEQQHLSHDKHSCLAFLDLHRQLRTRLNECLTISNRLAQPNQQQQKPSDPMVWWCYRRACVFKHSNQLKVKTKRHSLESSSTQPDGLTPI